jgi:hypothetical protein
MGNINPERYTVRISEGDRVSDAVAAHRERTGYGGAIVLEFAKSPAPLAAGG